MGNPTHTRRSIPFIKMHGLLNHFVIVDARVDAYRPRPEEIVRICDVRAGVGAEQLVVLEPGVSEGADVFMRLYNVNGQEVGASIVSIRVRGPDTARTRTRQLKTWGSGLEGSGSGPSRFGTGSSVRIQRASST